jgi:hypothetical protein
MRKVAARAVLFAVLVAMAAALTGCGACGGGSCPSSMMLGQGSMMGGGPLQGSMFGGLSGACPRRGG